MWFAVLSLPCFFVNGMSLGFIHVARSCRFSHFHCGTLLQDTNEQLVSLPMDVQVRSHTGLIWAALHTRVQGSMVLIGMQFYANTGL